MIKLFMQEYDFINKIVAYPIFITINKVIFLIFFEKF